MEVLGTAVAASILGAGGYAGYKALGPQVTLGAPRAASRDALLSSSKVGDAYPVVGGALAWNDEFERIAREDGTAYVRDASGRRIRTDNPAAGFACYDLVVELGARANILEELFYRSLDAATAERFYAGFINAGRYDLSGLSGLSKGLLAALIGCWAQWTNALRILGRLYQANNWPASMRPQRWAGRRIDLSRIIFHAGIGNPAAFHVNEATEPRATVRDVAFPGEWRLIGVEFLGRLMDAYPGMVQLSEGDADLAAESFQADANMRGMDADQTMGAITGGVLFGLLAGIALCIVGYGVARMLITGASGGMALAGANVAYMDEQISLYRAAMERCMDPSLPAEERDAACRAAETLATQIESYSRGVGWFFRVLLIGGGVAAGSYGLYRVVKARRKRKAAPKKTAPKQLESKPDASATE